MTAWQVHNLPVEIAGQPIGAVVRVAVDWDRARVAGFVIGYRVGSARFVPFGPGVAVDDRGVHLGGPGAVETIRRSVLDRLAAADWRDRPVWDKTGRVVGRIQDVEFDPATGAVHAVWVSRGVLGDLWHGMYLVSAAVLHEDGHRIVLERHGDAGR
jgi:sporulation protein YlmC with PRC-barrel domain